MEFFEGYSIPRNKELMRVYKDLEMVEQLGSGIPRILETYGRECFHFSENFLRMVFPAVEKVTPQVTPQVVLVKWQGKVLSEGQMVDAHHKTVLLVFPPVR